MQISLEWLSEFVDLKGIEPELIAYELTMSGLEVEGIEHAGAKFSNIVTAQIMEINPHPDADKLKLVTICNGTETKTVVCGAQNIELGQIVPFASIGSKVFSRKTGEMFELTPVKIRGVNSEGMLCSKDELGIENDLFVQEDGIFILNRFFPDVKIGENLEDVLDIKKDVIFHTAPTANRGDEMSVVGIARELSAIFNKKLNFSLLQPTTDLSIKDFEVEILDTDVCKYYSMGLLKDVKIKPSPKWMQDRLLSSGIRAINNVVDITNYVLLEYGQPLHAFDWDKVGNYLCVRRAKVHEKITTLDGMERDLTNDSVLIATKNEGVCVGGVFGGANSEVDANTVNIALESAYFVPSANRKSARSIGYRSEACARFERGVDIEMVKPALMRAMQLLVELADAKIDGIVETGENELENVDITLRFAQIKRLLGIEIEQEKCYEILERLGFTLLGKNESAAKFRTPSFRINDVTREIDLIEEISRIYGFDKIAPTLPKKTQSPEINFEEKLLKIVNDLFLGAGFNEAMSSSLIGEPLLKEFMMPYNKNEAVHVENAQSEDHTMLRQTMLANILQAVKYNFDNGQKNIWFYELGKIYFKKSPADVVNTGVAEIRTISGVISGEIDTAKWIKKPKTDFYTLKGVMESLFNTLGLTGRIQYKRPHESSENFNCLHPKRCAQVFLQAKTPVNLGVFGQIHPMLSDKHKFLQDVFVFELNLDEILKAVSSSTTVYKKISAFPQVQRDIAFITEKNIEHEQIEKIIKKSCDSSLFSGSELFDIYEGENIDPDRKSMAYRIKLQDKNATLTDEIVEIQIKNVKISLEKAFEGIQFRQ